MPDSRNRSQSTARGRENSVPGVHTVIRNLKLELEVILRHPKGLECFMRFAHKEANDEGIRFWAAVYHFRALFSDEDSFEELTPELKSEFNSQTASQARHIWDTYLIPGAQDEVSCADGINRDEIKRSIEDGRVKCDIFTEVQTLALQDIKHNSLSRFRQSADYTRFLDGLLGELQEPMGGMPSLVKNQAHFDLVLQNPLSRQLFQEYLAQKGAAAFVKFLTDVDIFREPSTVAERKREAVRMSDLYLKPSSLSSIRGVSEEKILLEAESNISSGSKSTFDGLCKCVREHLSSQFFSDFCQTPEFLQLRSLLEEYKKLRHENSQRESGYRPDESPRGQPSVSRSTSVEPLPRAVSTNRPVFTNRPPSNAASRLGFGLNDESSGFGYGPRFRDRYARPGATLGLERSDSRNSDSGKEKKESSSRERSRSRKDVRRLSSMGNRPTTDLLREIKERSIRIQVRDLMDLLADQNLVNSYKDFCISEHSEENIMFWIDCEKYRTGTPRLKLTAMAVYRKYLDPDAQYALALSSEFGVRILSRLESCPDDDEPDDDLFSEALQAVAAFMLSDSFPRYMKSRQLERLVDPRGANPAPASKPSGSYCVIQ